MKVYGIDLGTTYSAIAHIDELGTPQVIQNFEGDQTTPSVVLFDDASNFVVGREAKNEIELRPDETVQLIKRQMGDNYDVKIHDVVHSPESISALILSYLVETAEDFTGEKADGVVITVPAYFGVEARTATKQAGEIAGLNVLDIITEPVAAALSSGTRHGDNQTLLVYDLGDGTFDTTIMEMNEDGIEVLAVDGDRQLGGADWDEELYNLAVMNFVVTSGLEEDPTYDEDFVQNLKSGVEQAKIALTRRKSAKILCNYQNRVKANVEITREDFESATQYLVDQTLRVVERAIESAKKKRPNLQIDRYLLVGGSSRMPMVSEALESRFGWELTPTEFDLAVAKGAAIYAQGLVDAAGGDINVNPNDTSAQTGGSMITVATPTGARSMEIKNVLPKAVGVKFWDPEREVPYVMHVLEAGAELPAEATAQGFASNDNTTRIRFDIYEQAGEVVSQDMDANKLISGENGAVLQNLPNLPKGSPVYMIMKVTNDGIVSLEGSEPTTGQSVELTAQISALSDERVDQYKNMVTGMIRSE
ncbi:Hsp70 family protein [Corynebacterium riegelii]|uniref:Hsp70 family protein n=1 Tax=Corynebacterium riegelii TaxID=156976 RepID=UPI00254D1921|nr:Hsp70 family protein [Corynebacterium riegelii]